MSKFLETTQTTTTKPRKNKMSEYKYNKLRDNINKKSIKKKDQGQMISQVNNKHLKKN